MPAVQSALQPGMPAVQPVCYTVRMKFPRLMPYVPSWKNAALAAISSVLLILSFPDFEFWFLAWFALIPLFFAIEREKESLCSILRARLGMGIYFFHWHVLVADVRTDHLRRLSADHRLPAFVLCHWRRRDLSGNLRGDLFEFAKAIRKHRDPCRAFRLGVLGVSTVLADGK